MSAHQTRPGIRTWQQRLYGILFASDTPVGKAFDIFLLLLIVSSTAGVMLESIESIGAAHRRLFMILGYSIIAIPTGIVTVEISRAGSSASKRRTCSACSLDDHDADAAFCKRCGNRL